MDLTKLLRNKVYKVVDMGDDIMSRIEIISGVYEGVVYQYGKVVLDEQPDDCCLLSFEYELFQNPVGDGIRKDKAFEQLQGDILSEMLYCLILDVSEILAEKELEAE